MKTIALTLALLASLVGSAAADCDIVAFGATANNDADDDGPSIQAAIASCAILGGDVVVPVGTFDVGQAGGWAPYGVQVSAGVALRGKGPTSVLRQLPGLPGSVRLVYLVGAGPSIADLVLDGRRAGQSRKPTPGAEQRHGVFVNGATDVTLTRVTARQFTGDGFYLYTGADGTSAHDVRAEDNDRNGFTLGGADTDDTTITDSKFVGNGAQQIDSEGRTSDAVTITGCLLDPEAVDGWALTVSGSSGSVHSNGWVVRDNEIRGGIFVVWTDGVVIDGNRGVNATTKPSVRVYRSSDDVLIVGNVFTMTQTTDPYLGVVSVAGTGVGSVPTDVTIERNVLSVAHSDRYAVRVTGAKNVATTRNVIPGIVYYRTTIVGEPTSGKVTENVLVDYVEAGNGAAIFDPPIAVTSNVTITL